MGNRTAATNTNTTADENTEDAAANAAGAAAWNAKNAPARDAGGEGGSKDTPVSRGWRCLCGTADGVLVYLCRILGEGPTGTGYADWTGECRLGCGAIRPRVFTCWRSIAEL